jgi:hypothetical protein
VSLNNFQYDKIFFLNTFWDTQAWTLTHFAISIYIHYWHSWISIESGRHTLSSMLSFLRCRAWLQYGAFNFLYLGSNEERPYRGVWESVVRKLLTRANGFSRVSALPVIFQQKRQFSTVFSDAVGKYGFIGSLNESLTRRSITYTSGMRNEGRCSKSCNITLLKFREQIL